MEFLSETVVTRIRDIANEVGTLKNEVAAAERSLALANKNRELVELSGSKADEIIRKAKAEADSAKRKLSDARSKLMSAFIDESGRRDKIRANAWAQIYRDIVQPRAEKISTALQTFEQAVGEIIELLRPNSETIQRLDELDATGEAWNSLVDELNGPGNARLNTAAAAKSFRASLYESAQFQRFEVAVKKLKEALNPPSVPRTPLTEEQIAIERERSREAAFAESRRIKAESEQLSNREKTLLKPRKSS